MSSPQRAEITYLDDNIAFGVDPIRKGLITLNIKESPFSICYESMLEAQRVRGWWKMENNEIKKSKLRQTVYVTLTRLQCHWLSGDNVNASDPNRSSDRKSNLSDCLAA